MDEIANEFGAQTDKYLTSSGIWKVMTDKLELSLKVLSEKAKQRSLLEEARSLNVLTILLGGDPRMLICVDETHKDRNAARRRRGWSKRNVDCYSDEFFSNVIRYTMIGACDINGFIPIACECVIRDEISAEGAAGTVDRDYFLGWVKRRLIPVLGNFSRGEPRSVVYMDNASTHTCDELVEMIRDAGAFIIFGPPYSPHLNPIEKYFSVYKAYLI